LELKTTFNTPRLASAIFYLLQKKTLDCFKVTSVNYSNGYGLAWGSPNDAVKSCLVSLEKTNEIRVVVRGVNGFVSVNGN
jgi:hypothetical protein